MSDAQTTHPFATVHLNDLAVDLPALHKQVLHCHGRIEFRSADGGCCVLISKNELDAIEHALAVLAKTDDVRAMCKELSRLAAISAMPS